MTGCVPLGRAVEAARYGGKAASLAVALGAGLPVPDGVALSWQAVEALAAGDAALAEIITARVSALLDAGSARAAAVRSSAVGEDSAGSSFAGIFESVLGAREPRQILDAITAVWRSSRSDAAVAYRRQFGMDEPARMGVVIQVCVDASAAGVMFTRCPVSSAEERVIEGAWGLGEAVVAGLISPDLFRVDTAGNVLSRTPGDKRLARRLAADGSTREESVPPQDAARLCLGDDQLSALHRLAVRCDEVYRCRLHDIEWAFDGDRLYLLQRRPITRSP